MAPAKQELTWGERQRGTTAERGGRAPAPAPAPALRKPGDGESRGRGARPGAPGLPAAGAPYLGQGAGVEEGDQPGDPRHGPLLHGLRLLLGEGQQELGGEKLLVCPQHGALLLPVVPPLRWPGGWPCPRPAEAQPSPSPTFKMFCSSRRLQAPALLTSACSRLSRASTVCKEEEDRAWGARTRSRGIPRAQPVHTLK